MYASIYSALAAGAGLLTVLRNPGRSNAFGESEQSDHSLAAENLETRRETRYRSERSGTVSILGDPTRQAPCHIINASRSGLRVASILQFPKGAQVCVQWGEEFFVGAVLYTFSTGSQHVAGLELLSGNHRWHPLAQLCFWRRSKRP